MGFRNYYSQEESPKSGKLLSNVVWINVHGKGCSWSQNKRTLETTYLKNRCRKPSSNRWSFRSRLPKPWPRDWSPNKPGKYTIPKWETNCTPLLESKLTNNYVPTSLPLLLIAKRIRTNKGQSFSGAAMELQNICCECGSTWHFRIKHESSPKTRTRTRSNLFSQADRVSSGFTE